MNEMVISGLAVPNLVVFWALAAITFFAGWAVFTTFISELAPKTRWEIKVIYYLGRCLICAMAVVIFLLVCWGIMELSIFVLKT